MKLSKDGMVFLVIFGLLILVNLVLLLSGAIHLNREGFGIMVAAGFTIALYSFLYADNPLYKIAEHFYVGVAAAYTLQVSWYDTILRDVVFGFRDLLKEPMSAGGFWKICALALPSVLGLMLYTRFSKKTEWISRIPFSFVIGFGAGTAIPLIIASNILYQLKPTLVPLWTEHGFEWNAIVIFCGVISTLVYFFFSMEHKWIVGWIARVGVWFLMISFGASFGYTVMARVSLLIERVNFLFQTWIPLIPKG